MKQDNAHKSRVDRGWDKMQGILEEEMPIKNKDRRRILFWFFFGALGLSLLIRQLYPVQSEDPIHQNEKTPTEHDVMAFDESANNRNNINLSLTNNDKLPTEETLYTKELNKVETSTFNTGTSNQRANDLQNEVKLNRQSSEKLTTNVVPLKEAEIIVDAKTSNGSDNSGQIEDQTTQTVKTVDEIETEAEPVSKDDLESSGTNILPSHIERAEVNALMELNSLFPLYIQYADRQPSQPAIMSPIEIKPVQNKGTFFAAISAHGSMANPLDFRGWNAGINIGIQKSRFSYSLFGRYSCLQRSLQDQSVIDLEPALDEDDLMSGLFDTMTTETIIVDERINEKLYLIESGISFDINLGKRFYFNVSPGIDFIVSNTTNIDAQEALYNPAAANQYLQNNYVPTAYSSTVIPFISSGLSYNISGGVYLNAYYKRQLKNSVVRPEETTSLNAFNAGLKYEF